ncbi:ergothioneine biosynthesis protein EgtC [Nocardia spumae]|uniref:ergothioneine biosynthesis protein EgtC n=1 Tax=Nocardia spumae TaxID=2887190 RepID=UPI001D14C021|nr:ergothioneine biosynthesis protein EgtC [Nocardia spumae]
MCRHLGYLGPPAAVGELLTRGAHSLRTQAWAPNDMRRGGTINADGFGVAWWVPAEVPSVDGSDMADGRTAGRIGGRSPIALLASRYRNSAPIWTDPAVDEVLPQLRSTAVLGAVRSATVGMPVERSACAPFIDAGWAFSHNGVIPDWRLVLPTVAARFGAPDLLTAEAATDSAVLWVILCAALSGIGHSRGADGHSAGSPEGAVPRADAVAEVLAAVACAVLAQAPGARLNLLLGDGETLWATTVYHSLSVLVADDFAAVASEPYDDDPRWREIADRQVLTVRPGHLTATPLDASPQLLSAGPAESERARP